MGFTKPDRSPCLLVSSYLTVSPLPRTGWCVTAVCFLLALSLALRPVGVTDHPALRSPDFPPTPNAPATIQPTWKPQSRNITSFAAPAIGAEANKQDSRIASPVRAITAGQFVIGQRGQHNRGLLGRTKRVGAQCYSRRAIRPRLMLGPPIHTTRPSSPRLCLERRTITHLSRRWGLRRTEGGKTDGAP